MLAASVNIPFSMFVRDLKMPRVNALLNNYRKAKEYRIIRREDQKRELIRLIRANESCGITIDQGGKNGIRVLFFNKDASMAAGAVRLALKYDTTLLPAFTLRINGPYIKLIIEPAFRLIRTGDDDADIKANLQELARLFEKYLHLYPQEYLWYYRVWKYSSMRDIVILSDAKAGHLRQSQALARFICSYLKDKGFDARVHELEVRMKGVASRALLYPSGIFSSNFTCQGCLACLRQALTADSYSRVAKARADIVISCGSSLAAVNRIITIENQAKSIVIMKPGHMPLGLFDLAIIARHDNPRPAPNVIVTEGALNLIGQSYLAEQGQKLRQHIGLSSLIKPVIGVLFGGDAKGFHLSSQQVQIVCTQLKDAAHMLKGSILVSTSRRTSVEAATIVKRLLGQDSRCRFLVIANERNFDFSVGGILDASDIVVISPESISMISEAASAGAYVVVFDAPGLSRKHKAVLSDFEKKGYIRSAAPEELTNVILQIWRSKPPRCRLDNSGLLLEGLRKIL